MKKLKYLLFLSIIFLAPSVFADTSWDMTNLITSPVNFSECGTGSYTGVEQNGSTNCWNTKTRYQGTLNRIYFNLPAPTGNNFETDTAYRLTLKMATNDWRNNFGQVVVSPGSSYINNFVDSFSFVSKQQINITFTIPYGGSTTYQSLYVNLPSSSSSHLITGVSNWNLSSVVLTKLTSGSGGGSTTPSGPSTTWDDTGIINNNNENTQDIINNNNTNTQDIINNNNQNTQDIINNNNQNTDRITDILGDCYYNLMDPNFVQARTLDGISYSPVRNYSGDTLEYILLNGTATDRSFYPIWKGSFTTYFDYYIYQNNFPNGVQIFCATDNDTDRYYTTIPSNTTITSCYIRVSNGITLNNLKAYPQFSLYQNAPYTPYGIQKCFSKLDNISDDINSVGSNVINGINSATQNAINNSTQNTQDIINNNNQNTNKEIESQQVCNNYDKSSLETDNRVYTSSSGYIGVDNGWGLSSYIPISNKDTLKASRSVAFGYACFLTSSKTVISCINQANLTISSDITIPTNASYFRFSINKGQNIPQFSLCKNGNQAMNDTLTDTNNYLKDDSDPTISDSALNDVFGRVHFTDPLSYLLTLPTQLINKIVSLSDTCSPIDLGTLYGVHLTLPCINLENYLGSELWTILDIILSVGLLSVILKNFYDTISNLLTLGGEKEAKEKFSMPTPMDFLAMILGGDNR